MRKITSLSLAAASFLSLVSPVLAQDVNIVAPNNLRITNIGKLLSAVIGIILVIAVIAALFFLLLAGLQWITSGGDKAGVEAAQKKIQAALIGLVLVFTIFALFTLVGNFLGINPFQFNLPKPY